MTICVCTCVCCRWVNVRVCCRTGRLAVPPLLACCYNNMRGCAACGRVLLFRRCLLAAITICVGVLHVGASCCSAAACLLAIITFGKTGSSLSMCGRSSIRCGPKASSFGAKKGK